jgi:hypothetical protein
VLDAGDATLVDVFHTFEQDNGLRWTVGDATVPAALFANVEQAGQLELKVDGAMRYPQRLPARWQRLGGSGLCSADVDGLRPCGITPATTMRPAGRVREAASISLISRENLVAGAGFEPAAFRL